MHYHPGDKVIYHNKGAAVSATVEVRLESDAPEGPRYWIRVSEYTVALVGEDMLRPAPEEKGEAR